MEYTIAEDVELPSGGQIYDVDVNPHIRLRSITTEEEMLRHNPLHPYKVICDIIDKCIVEEPLGISSYDLHIGDYQYLYYRLRAVSNTSMYHTTSHCPYCKALNNHKINIDDLGVVTLDEHAFTEASEFELPVSKNKIRVTFMTPRKYEQMMDEVNAFKRDNPDSELDIQYLFDIVYSIATVDGHKKNLEDLKIWARRLPLRDANCIIQHATKLNEGVGVNNLVTVKCPNPLCGVEYPVRFLPGSDFFGPADD